LHPLPAFFEILIWSPNGGIVEQSARASPRGRLGDWENVASEQSYTITLNNNLTEKAAIDYLLSTDPRLWVPDKESRKHILAELKLDRRLARAFDLVLVEGDVAAESELRVADISRISLVELKTTRKRLPELPRGFFFGATQNEFDLAAALGERFQFCFVCLHPDTLGHRMLTLDELRPLIRTQRTQYQINL
jgi:hypothetical protein